MSPVPIYTPWWRETKCSKVPCLRKQRDGRGLNPGPPDPELYPLGHTLLHDVNYSNEMFSQITTLTTGDFDNLHKINDFGRLHWSGQIFKRSIFYMCNLFTRNHKNSVTDCRTVYKVYLNFSLPLKTLQGFRVSELKEKPSGLLLTGLTRPHVRTINTCLAR